MPEDLSDFFEAPATLELVAAVEHERWSHWQRYLHGQCSSLEDGSLVIPAHLVAQWSKQMSTPYKNLSEKEKESDREQAREYITAMQRALNL
ncbi:hypothetical protein [Nesterenkonia rhizosphaerae]|uniref:Uncharacterized protein n=1 Tax=Nesterenkonia rhizosphaerae TaxID=1348272 RepID=A0ABP9FYJ0_9MICC